MYGGGGGEGVGARVSDFFLQRIQIKKELFVFCEREREGGAE